MKKMLFTLFLFGAGLFITGCFVDTTWPFIGGDVVNEKTIKGITAPVEGKNPVTEIDATQYTGKVTWLPTVGPEGSFKGKQVYTAVITLAPKSGYTFLGIQKNFFTVAGADSASNSVCSTFDECVVRAVFPNTTPFPSKIEGVTVPVVGETPVYIISGRDDYKGSISWSPDHNTFRSNVSYTATIELTGLNGYSLPAIDNAGYFKIDGTESCSYDYLTGKVTATFPATIDGVTFEMARVPGDLEFKIYTDDKIPDDKNLNTITKAYLIGETEVTYELWYEVRIWGEEHGYVFANKGVEGNDGTAGAAPTEAKQEPVTTVNWRDAVVWCNALTEWHNAKKGTSFDCVYYTDSEYKTPLRTSTKGGADTTSGSADNPYIMADESGNIDIYKCIAKGFRLPTFAEWSAAARYKGSDSSNGAYEYPLGSSKWWTPGNYASGDIEVCEYSATLGDYAVYKPNSDNKTASVKSKNPNALGLYDMSGNVFEWIFDEDSTQSTLHRLLRNGHYSSSYGFLEIGHYAPFIPSVLASTLGFRFVRTE